MTWAKRAKAAYAKKKAPSKRKPLTAAQWAKADKSSRALASEIFRGKDFHGNRLTAREVAEARSLLRHRMKGGW